jgi:chaperonin GroES
MSDEALNFRPLGDRVLVRHDDSGEKERSTGGGIVIPEGTYVDESEIMTWGTVVAVGPGRWSKTRNIRIPTEVQVGDRVLYNRFLKRTNSGEAFAEKIGDDYVLLNEDKDIVAVEEQD